MSCSRCGAENRDAMKFCGQCGAPLGASCSSCGYDNPADHRFCGQCGAPLPLWTHPRHEGEAKAGAVALSGEMKQVTILFCDIVGSTPLTERLGPEAMRDLVSSFLRTSLAEVHRYGGTASQFAGDGFMALFGAPVAQEDHVQRALLAALAIQRALGGAECEDEAQKLDLPVRLGIHTGPVVFGPLADNLPMDPTAIGDTANLAARLQQAAEPATILLSEATYQLARSYANVEPVGPLALRGKADPIPAYRLLAVSQARAALRASTAARTTTFVNRHADLAILNKFLRQVEGGRRQAVGIVGEPGIGKSRLLAEFRRQLGEGRVNWIEGRCVSYGTAIPYLLVLDLVRSNCGIVETDTPEAVAEKVRSALKQVRIEAEEDAAVLLHLLGVKEAHGSPALANPETVKARAFHILSQIGINLSRQRPLVLVLEDLHWIDKISEEFLGFFAENTSEARILMLATYRPGYHAPWLDKSYAGQTPLSPLSRDDSIRMVHSVLRTEDLVELVAEEIVTKADGNPFFLEQLALHTGEALRSNLRVPDTIHDVVMARIDRLPEETKNILQIAAVIGREFSPRLLGPVWRREAALELQLRELARLEFIDEHGQAEGSIYVFRHALTREAVYGSLLERQRRTYHGAIGCTLEELYAARIDEVAEMLAFHFGRSDEAEKSVDYAILAAEKSQRRWANNEALTYFNDALRRLDAMPDTEANRLRRIDAVLKQGDVKFALGRHGEHLQKLDDIGDIVRDAGDPRRRASWHYWSGYLRSLTGKGLALAIDDCRAAAAIAAAVDLDEIAGFATSSLAMAYSFAGRPREAIEAGEQALAIFEAGGNRLWASRTLWHLSLAANMLGEWETSLAYCRRALAHGAAVDDRRSQAIGLWRMGSVHVQRGDPRSGIKCCDEALALAPSPYDAAHTKAVRGYGQIKMGRLDAGVTEIAESLAWFERFQLRQPSLRWALWLVEGYLLRGDVGRARSLAIDILNESREAGYRHIEGLACWLMSDCLGRDDDPSAAEEYVEQAIRIFEEIGARNDFAKALTTRAELLWRAGDSVAARQLFGEARDIFAALGTRDEQAMVEDALGEVDRGSALSRHHHLRSVRPPAGPQSAD